MIKVSVIVPTYNAESTIKKAIESIINQTYQNFEIIIVDDVSTDSTYSVLQELKESDTRIRVYQNQVNSKSSFTRNYAINKSTGEYIMQLDDDDTCDPTRMARQVDFLEKHLEYGFVGSNCLIFDDSGVYSSKEYKEKPTEVDFVKTSPFLNPSIMFRKKALEQVNGYRVSEETVRGQDYDLFMRLYIAGIKGYNLQQYLVNYYQDSNYFNKISWKNRVGETKFRYRNFKKMGLLPKNYLYVLKPIMAMITPNFLLQWNGNRKNK
ncbi:glycosyltransferase family 2 protein [Enterococcus casseliflavus]|uniref:glycosyltransferase family 2 protein n=1 Tax=Enterococcus casseliflavus TaxID=37734 RepID=UPI0035CC8B71